MMAIRAAGSVLALFAVVGMSAAQTGPLDATTSQPVTSGVLPDCVCNTTWVHDEYGCSGGKPATFNGCPTLEALSICENEPKQSWCATTAGECKGQTGDSVDDGWVYCDPDSGGKPQLPKCTCKAKWKHREGVCADYAGGAMMFGCPTIEQIRQCEPNYKWNEQSWCETEEALCQEQEDWNDAYNWENETKQKGAGWVYCNAYNAEPELPNCDCGDATTGEVDWTPTLEECPGFDWEANPSGPVFDGCTTSEDYVEKCGLEPMHNEGVDQPWCYTMQGRCKQQSTSVTGGFATMVGDYWSYCSVKTELGVFPNCECKDSWIHDDQKCAGKGMALEMTGCPTTGKIGMCETRPEYSWCDTTYDSCAQQPDSEHGEAWAYCDAKTQEVELPPCQCKWAWTHDEGDGGFDVCDIGNPMSFRGCPTLEEQKMCEPNAKWSWCQTTDQACREQTGDMMNDGWAKCDPKIQRTVIHKRGIGQAIGVTFLVTFVVCVAFFAAFLMMYRKYLQTNRWKYSQKLLEAEEGTKL